MNDIHNQALLIILYNENILIPSKFAPWFSTLTTN